MAVMRCGWVLPLLLLGIAACDDKTSPPEATPSAAPASSSPEVAGGREIFVNRCMACHTIGEGDRTGPDLKDVGKRRDQDWLVKWIKDPVSMGDTDHVGKEVSAKYGNVIMPKLNLSDAEIEQVLAFIMDASKKGGFKAPPQPARELQSAEFQSAKSIFFDRCAGCHGALRQGGTGPALTPDRTKRIGTVNLRATLNHGRPGGMPNWGELGILSTHDVDLLANYLQMPPPSPPELGFDEVKKSWNLKVPVAERPKAPPKRNWKNFFAVVMQKEGQLAIIDGDTKERLTLIDVGFAVDRVRASASGRYLYVLGRDGRISLVDLFVDPPTSLAQARGCFDARALESSKYKAQADKLVIEGCYWPPQYVVFDGTTLEPKRLQSLVGSGETARSELRVGSIVAPRDRAVWALSLTGSGQVALVDSSKPDFPVIARIPAMPQILDGALDHTGRYFLLPAAGEQSLAVVDLVDKKLADKLATGKDPRVELGANWEDPEFGWVFGVAQGGADKLLVVGADPKTHADRAWKMVREVGGIASGALFVRTHPKSAWVWIDSPANPNAELARQICVIAKKTGKLEKCWKAAKVGRVMNFEYSQDGSEVWVSVWDKQGAIVVYDDASLNEKQRIEGDWVSTPARKYNVFNLANDVN